MKLDNYKDFTSEQLEKYFLDIKNIFKYSSCITPINLYWDLYKRVWSHTIYVEKKIVEEAILKARYNIEIKKLSEEILTRLKIINNKEYILLIDHKNDQTREVLDYIIYNNIITTVYVISPDNMFWYFHDIWHWYLSDICDNFYENVYWYPEMLVNIFAAFKQKQYKLYSRTNIDKDILEKCNKYDDELKKYFFSILDSLNFKDDI